MHTQWPISAPLGGRGRHALGVDAQEPPAATPHALKVQRRAARLRRRPHARSVPLEPCAAPAARQVPALRELLELRDKLKELEGKLEGNDKLEKLLNET